MTLQEFKNKYLGKQVEFHSYGSGAYNQCVDLVNAYINEVLDNNTKDYTEIIGTNAKDFNTKYDPEDFEWIANTPTGVPQRGDIVVWNGRVGGGAGHVAIFLSGDANSFESLDQNWSQVERVTIERHNYNNVSGWLRPKNAPSQDDNTYRGFDLTNRESMKVAVDAVVRLQNGELIEQEKCDKIVGGYKSRITDLEKKLESEEGRASVEKEKRVQAEKALAEFRIECDRQIESLKRQLNEAQKDTPDLEKMKEEYEGQLRVERESREALQKKLSKANIEIARLKAGRPSLLRKILQWILH